MMNMVDATTSPRLKGTKSEGEFPKSLLVALFGAPNVLSSARNPAKYEEQCCVCWNVQVEIREAVHENASAPDQRSQRSYRGNPGVRSQILESTAIKIHYEPHYACES